MSDDFADAVSKALRRAYSLGQTYWQQADSESYSQNRKADDTSRKFTALVDETLALARSGQAASGCSHTARSDGQNGGEHGATPPAPAALDLRAAKHCCAILGAACEHHTHREIREAWQALRSALAASPQPAAPVEDLAMMIRMLVSSLKRHWLLAPQPNDLPSRAMELLRRHGLQGSPLREADDGAPKQSAPAAEGGAS